MIIIVIIIITSKVMAIKLYIEMVVLVKKVSYILLKISMRHCFQAASKKAALSTVYASGAISSSF